MSQIQSDANRVGMIAIRDAPDDDGTSCSSGPWGCLNSTAQFGVIFSIFVVVITIVWVYWYTVIRPRRAKIKESDEDIELDLGDGRTIVVSSGPYQRTVVFRGARPPTPPPPAYRPPTPSGGGHGDGSIETPATARTTESPQPSPRGSATQIWPPQAPPARPQTPQHALPLSTSAPTFVQGYPFPGSYSQPIPPAMYPPQFVVPGPPPPPPAMMYPRAQPQTYFVMPPPPPPPPGMPAQSLIPPPPAPPPSQLPSAGIYQQPLGPSGQLRTRPPSPGHASTIEDDGSDRGGSLPPAGLRARSPTRNRSPPAGGSMVTRSRSPSPSELRRLHASRYPIPTPTPSPPRGRQRDRTQQGKEGQDHPQQDDPKSDNPSSNDTSYKSSDSLDSELRSDLASLLVEAGDRQRAREAARLQAIVDRYDKEEEEERQHRNERALGGDLLPRLPGQPMRPALRPAEAADHVAATNAQQQDPERSYQGDGADATDKEDGQTDPPRRHVAFHEPSLEILESRVGRPSRPSQSPARIPTREDLHHGRSRVGHRRRTLSPDERIVERTVAPVSGRAESRVGKHQPPSPSAKHPVSRRDSCRFPGAGESRVGHHHGRKRRGTNHSETVSSEAGPQYYTTHNVTHGGHPTVDDGFLLNIARSEGPPSSAGATCGTRSPASTESNDQRRRMGLTPSRFNRRRDQRGHEDAPYSRSPSTEESDIDEQEKHSRKTSLGSRLASFLPTIAKLTTNNPVVREVADDIAEEAFLGHGLPNASRSPASDATLVARARSQKQHGCRDPPMTATAATDDARAPSPRSHAKACSSLLSMPLSASQKKSLGRVWTEAATTEAARAAQIAIAVIGREEAEQRTPSYIPVDRLTHHPGGSQGKWR
ncbi:hypothetical protein diail_1723 [Diaporthe ilicicola]|nr:hypothetical protein diail_1723 [Diaporthe ilicicola]